jgi:diguanylate cyclase (GGDEF)-like protein/PAS domain S-box-containing protein
MPPRAVDSPAPAVDADLRERRFVDTEALAHVGSWEWDATADRSVWSDEMCRIYGQPLGFAPTYAEFRRLVHPDDREIIGGGGVELPLAMRRYEAWYRIVRPDGEIRYVHGRRDVRRDERGNVTYAFGTTQDVTEQHEAKIARQEAQELFETAFSHAPIGMALIGLDGRWLKVNRAVCTMIGWPETELLERTFQDITHPDDLEADLAQVQRLLAGAISEYQIEKRYLTRTGSEIWALLSVSLVRDADGQPRHFISQIEDISQRKRAEERLREAEADARLQRDHATAIIGAMHEGYAFTVEGEIKAVNHALSTVTGFTREQLVGARPPYPFWAPELTDEMEELRRRVNDEDGGMFEVMFMRVNGERFEAELTVQPARDANGQTIGFVSTMRDVSVQNRQHRELERLARTDSLTGLANRHVLQESLHHEAGRRTSDKQQLALVLLDLDLFKQVNDAHGHPAGDAVLIEVASRLMLTVRAGEVLARVGGEEFAWLLPASSVSEAIAAADRARAAIASRPFVTAGTLTMSAGVGLLPTPSDGDELYRLADRALYEAKQKGRNRTCCHTGESTALSLEPLLDAGEEVADALVVQSP